MFMDPQAREKQMKMDETVVLSAKDLDFTVSREGLCTVTEYCQHVMQSLIYGTSAWVLWIDRRD